VSFSLSPQLRLIVLFGVLAAMIALGGMFFVLRGSLLSAEVEQVPPVVHHPKPAQPTPTPTPTPATPAPKTAPKFEPKFETTFPQLATPRIAAPKVTLPRPSSTIKVPGVAANGLPIIIAQALRKQSVLVVALVVPGGELDRMTIAEARAGAKAAGVGFLTVNILKNSVGRPLAQKLGVIQTPTLVVYRRPATVFVRFHGFTDRDTVTQAATSARRAR
jgi:hypothetical protein